MRRGRSRLKREWRGAVSKIGLRKVAGTSASYQRSDGREGTVDVAVAERNPVMVAVIELCKVAVFSLIAEHGTKGPRAASRTADPRHFW